MEQIIKDFKDLLEERQKKQEKISQKDITTEREKDEIQDDFINDKRRIEYHKLRKRVKGNSVQEKEFMETQNKVFNSN
jgi:hypothetical protein